MNRNELRAAIARNGITIGDFCREAHISTSTFHRKMQDPTNVPGGVPEFTQGEISRMVSVLHLSKDDLVAIFFGN